MTIQGATVGAVNVGRKLSAYLPADHTTIYGRSSPERFPSELEVPYAATAGLQVGRRLSWQANAMTETGSVAVQGGTSGTDVTIGRKMLQQQVSNSGPVTIQGSSIGNVNTGH